MGKRKTFTVSKPTDIKGLGMKLSGGYSVNLLPENGTLKKRSGWRVLHSFRDDRLLPMEINGIYEYKGEEDSCLIVRAGNKLYRSDYEFENVSVITTPTLERRRAQAHMFAGKLWLGGMGYLAYYNGEAVCNAQNLHVAYAPHTSAEIYDTESTMGSVSKESPNLLFGKRINTLRGEKHTAEEYRFALDSSAEYGTSFSLEAQIRVRRKDDGESGIRTTDYVAKKGGERFGGIVTVRFKTESLSEDEGVSCLGVFDERGNAVTLEGANLSCHVEHGKWVVLGFNAVAPDTRDNITVEYTSHGELDGLSPEVFTTVSTSSGSAMLFTCGTNRLYVLYEREGLLYAPKNQVIDVGQKTEKITALLPLPNGYVGVYKENGFYTVRIAGDELKAEAYSSSDFYGCISPFAYGRLGYDCISFCNEGVFGVDEIKNAEYQVNRLRPRATAIQKELSAFSQAEREEACATVFGERYYLFIGTGAFVTDMQLTDGEYEWWYLESCPCRFATAAKGTLYMGRESGDVVIFDDGYTDRDGVMLKQAERDFVLVDDEATVAVFHHTLKVKEGDKVSLPPHYVRLGQCNYSYKKGKITVPNELFWDSQGHALLYDGMDVLVLIENDYIVYEGKIKDTEMYSATVDCGALPLSYDTTVTLCVKRGSETEYVLGEIKGQLCLNFDGAPIRLYSTDLEWVYLKREQEIECALYTAQTDLCEDKEKTLLSVIASFSADTACDIKIGCETAKNTFSREVKISSGMNFDFLDFHNVGFSTQMKKRIRVHCLEKNFDYLRLFFISNGGREMSIDGLSLIYMVK